MKYRIYAIVFLLLHACSYAEDISGNSVFVDFENFDLYSTTGYNLIVNQQHEKGHVLNKPEISASIFGGKTIKESSSDLNKFFLFNGKKQLTVKETIPGSAVAELAQDILSGDFNIETVDGGHDSTISFNPKQSRIGFVLSLRIPFHEKYWFNIDAPFMHKKQSLELKEVHVGALSNVDNSAAFRGALTRINSMFEAFRQTGLEYGRIDGAQKKDGLADLKLRIGRNTYNREDLFVSQYVGVVIPTGNRRTAKYVWEPMIGNGHHVGIDWGNTIQICAYEAKRCNWWVTNAITGQYLFENTQKRSLDLNNGPWTRYLAMYANAADLSTDTKSFGINLMTKDVNVSPGVSFNIASQLSVVSENWNINVGVINRFRQAETIELTEEWVEGPQIANIGILAAVGTGEVIPSRKMGRGFDVANLQSTSSIFIKESDINLNSAAHPNVFVSTLHGSIAYFNDGKTPQNYEFGGSVDTSRQNSAIDRWSLYGKLLVSF